MESITEIIADFEKRINDLQRDKDGLKQTLLDVSTMVEGLNRRINMLEKSVSNKVDVPHVQRMIKQSEVVKKINESESIGTDCKVSINLDGKVIAESIDSIKCRAIKE
ncbi:MULTISPECIES: hypothetical protein [Bacillus cereus group]|uniref:DUF3450 domain-containing protein n=1 Tax=Bacillus cereus TaxID=1396 RepID=A0A9W7UYA5_BACCE|nr:hypothetical protein [Bacillus cereus]KAB2398910.1 DUF3450 domain-containing protein [Bacillus cereus]KAB2409494.1 DUF3450 domain-containing protein [Bacillus cereus]KAB2426070.1 DUF3450 domain-containing protein [Bacillus cereus]